MTLKLRTEASWIASRVHAQKDVGRIVKAMISHQVTKRTYGTPTNLAFIFYRPDVPNGTWFSQHLKFSASRKKVPVERKWNYRYPNL